MYIRFTKSKKSKNPTLQIIQGFREGKKVKQKVIASLGVIKTEKDKIKISKLAENLIKKLEKEDFPIEKKVNLSDLTHKETVCDGFRLVIDKLMELTEFSNVFKNNQGKRTYDINEIVKLIIIERFHDPSSKLRTFERQKQHGFKEIELHQIYRTMDAIYPLKENIQKLVYKTIQNHSYPIIDCFFFDVTTLYFESVIQDNLKNFGFSKDQKHHSVQIVLSMVVDSNGIPLAYDVFEGNVAETKTLIPVIESLKQQFKIKNVTVVCDRGLTSLNNINALKANDFNFIIASKLRSFSKEVNIKDLHCYEELPNQKNIILEERVLYKTMKHPQYKDTTLIVTYSPKRAEKDRQDRIRLIEKLENKLSNKSNSIKKVISNSGYKKYLDITKDSSITLNKNAIEEDKSWDGFHGIAMSNNYNLGPIHALSRYKELWRVEEAFRVAKSTLKTRPIFHWTKHRIESHVLLCFITLFLERFLELLLKKENYPLTPDKIKYALTNVHSIFIENNETNKIIKIPSKLSNDAKAIFKSLNISLDRKVKDNVVAKF